MSPEAREALARVLCLEFANTRAQILDAAIRNAVSDLTGLAEANESGITRIDVVTIAQGIIARLNAACDLGDFAELDAERAEAAKRAEAAE